MLNLPMFQNWLNTVSYPIFAFAGERWANPWYNLRYSCAERPQEKSCAIPLRISLIQVAESL